jgi:parvulin-like peptidyl-prolyl isomerase
MKKIKRTFILIVVLSLLSITGFSAEAPVDILDLEPDFIVASINGEPITAQLLDVETNLPFTLLKIKETNEGFYELLLSSEAGYDFLVDYKRRVLYTLVDAMVLVDLAKQRGVMVNDGDIKGYINTFLGELLATNNLNEDEFEQYILTQGYNSLAEYKMHLELQRKLTLANFGLMDTLFDYVQISDGEVAEYMAANPVDNTNSNSVHLYHILLNDTTNINAVFNTINNEGFDAAVLQYSRDDLTRNNHGDLGWIERGVFKDFDTAFDQNPGDVIGPIKTELGYHILRVAEFSGGEFGQSQANEDVRMILKREKQLTLWEDWLKVEFPKEKAKYNIELSF